MLILKQSGVLSWRAIHEARAVALAELSAGWVTAFFQATPATQTAYLDSAIVVTDGQ